jgi:hypothetical protein
MRLPSLRSDVVLVLSLCAGAALASTVPSSLPSPEVTEGATIPARLDKRGVTELRRTFRSRLDRERIELKISQDRYKKERDADRKRRKKEWDQAEKDARRKFFAENAHGPERREYIRAFLERRKAFYAQLKDEERNDKLEREARWKALEEEQKTRMNAVEESLARGERPDSRWF